jgi:Type VI secretion system, TssC, VipB
VLIDFLNRRAFENFNSRTQADIQKQITKFLDSVTGPGKLIEKFKILRFEQDEVQKDRIHLDIYMLPYFPGKTFMIKLDGQKGLDPDSAAWAAEYQQNNA